MTVPQVFFPCAVEKCISKKRRKRVNTPFIYSSAAMHCLNKFNTAKWGRKQNVAALEEELKILLKWISKFSQHYKNIHDKRSLCSAEKLDGRNNFPSKVFHIRREASSDLDKANLFNQFFNSVFQTKTTDSLCISILATESSYRRSSKSS